MSTSSGFLGLDTFLNVFGNAFTVFEVVDGFIERKEHRERDAKEDALKAIEQLDTSEHDFREELKQSVGQVVTQLEAINEHLASHLIPFDMKPQPEEQPPHDPQDILRDQMSAVVMDEKENEIESRSMHGPDDNMGLYSQMDYNHRYFLSPRIAVQYRQNNNPFL